MIDSKKIINVCEEYFSSLEVREEYVEIFVNPSYSELYQLGNYVRFTANPITKRLYAWDARLAIHNQVRREIGADATEELTQLHGEATRHGQKYIMEWSDALKDARHYRNSVQKELNYLLNLNWTWADRYIAGISDYIVKEKRKLIN
jgi:hypothetical protein